jgi:hypothetical protein
MDHENKQQGTFNIFCYCAHGPFGHVYYLLIFIVCRTLRPEQGESINHHIAAGVHPKARCSSRHVRWRRKQDQAVHRERLLQQRRKIGTRRGISDYPWRHESPHTPILCAPQHRRRMGAVPRANRLTEASGKACCVRRVMAAKTDTFRRDKICVVGGSRKP